MSDSPPGEEEEFEGSGMFEGSGLFEGSGVPEDGSGFDDGGEDDEEEGPLYYFLEESTGYMEPAMAFLSIIHTIISFLCIIGYNCLKVSNALCPSTPLFHISACMINTSALCFLLTLGSSGHLQERERTGQKARV